ncbi:MAG: DUF4340 domain-containing protein [Pseudomonadota bacterium]
MKKEYYILTILIVCLSAYLWFHTENRDNYKLPDIPKIDTSSITSILIEKKDGPVQFTRKDKNWTLTDKNFPADMNLVEILLDTLKTFKLTALVSQTSDLKRYELDQENQIHVMVTFGEKGRFEFFAGKEAPSFNHTFVMLAGDKNVYHAKGSFRNDFDQDVNAFRDKTILKVTADAVKQLTVSKGKISKTLNSKESTDKEKTTVKTWQTADGKPVDTKTINDFLASIAYLKCDTYADDNIQNKLNKAAPICSIQIDAQEKTQFFLYTLDGSDDTYGTSSLNDYVFVLSDFDAKEIISNIETLLGIKPKEK